MKKQSKLLAYKVIECVDGYAVIRIVDGDSDNEVMAIYSTREQAINSLVSLPWNNRKPVIGGFVKSCIVTPDTIEDNITATVETDTSYNGYLIFKGDKLIKAYQRRYYAIAAAMSMLLEGETAKQYNLTVQRWVNGVYDCDLLLTRVKGRYIYDFFGSDYKGVA